MAKHKLIPESWVSTYSDQLLGYAAQRVPDRDMAKDLVQDTFVTALRTKANYRGEVSEKNWLFIILKSRILDHYKKKRETLASELMQEDDDEDSSYFDHSGHWLKSKLPKEWTTDNLIRNNEFMEVFANCKSKLKEMQQVVFTMKYVDGEETEVICKELNITSSNYWVLVHRAKLGLRECLEKKWSNQ